MEHTESRNQQATISGLPGRRERLAAQIRRAEAFLRDALETLDAPGDHAAGDASAPGVTIAGSCDRARATLPPADDASPILVVDLHKPSRTALGELLRASGYTVLEAGSSRDLPPEGAVAPALVVFDPGPHLEAGIRTIAMMRIEETAPVPVVLLTPSFTPELRDRAIAIGCTEVLGKPCVPAELLAVVARLAGMPPFSALPEIPRLVARGRREAHAPEQPAA